MPDYTRRRRGACEEVDVLGIVAELDVIYTVILGFFCRIWDPYLFFGRWFIYNRTNTVPASDTRPCIGYLPNPSTMLRFCLALLLLQTGGRVYI